MAKTRRGKRDSIKRNSKSDDVKKIDIDPEKVSAAADAEVAEKVVQALAETPAPAAAEDNNEDATPLEEAPETKQNTAAAEDDVEKVIASTHTGDVNDDEMRRLSFIGDLTILGKEAEGNGDDSSWTSSEASSLPDQEGEVLVADDENKHGNSQSVPGSEDDTPSSGDTKYLQPSQTPSTSKVEGSSLVTAADDENEHGNNDSEPGTEANTPSSGDAHYVQPSQAPLISKVEDSSFVDVRRELQNEAKKVEDTSSLASRAEDVGNGEDGLGNEPKTSKRGEYESAQENKRDASKAAHKEKVESEYEIDDDEEREPWIKRVAALLCCSKMLR
mmetsp:Transcript_26070/g.47272  ORF Transcript_26070/g.47272 Transcript_26070/m.47272 type:complete len:331 (-) Transcript_26070:74-1066(-)